jgi:hypothetical protein
VLKSIKLGPILPLFAPTCRIVRPWLQFRPIKRCGNAHVLWCAQSIPGNELLNELALGSVSLTKRKTPQSGVFLLCKGFTPLH